jgi:D-3-phosphoglycerate dehydrogenase
VYAAADVVTLHLPLNEETRGLLGADAFAQMRDGVRIVNAARGELVDEDALAAAIREGKVAGAALDVFGMEPYSGPLLELEQVIVTPHLAASTAEAQDRAGVIIAEQVVSALEGGLVATAVNIPIVEQSDLEVLGPFIPLAAKLGRLASSLLEGRPRRIVVAAHGPLSDYDTRLLTVAALNGVFQSRVDQAVNYVNAPVIAAERGLEVSEQRFGSSQHYTNLVRVVIAANGEEIEVSGTTVGPEHRLFLAGALGFAIDIELAPHMAFLDYEDMPGVIGRVGTMFGEAGVNIANMAVSRTKEGGKALMAFSIDTPAPADLVERVRAEGFGDARFIDLG